MPDQLSLRGGTTTEHASFTGANKEATVDTTKKTLVIHDGATVGGHPLMRENASNSALALGSAATPSLKFTGDTNTGIYSPGADQVSVATGGTERLRIDSTGQIEAVSLGTAAAPVWSFLADPNTGIYSPDADQVAISTGGTGRLFVDASGRLGLGISSPSTLMHLSSATGTASPTPTELRIATISNGSDWSTTNPWGRLSFYSADASGSGPRVHAAIDATTETTSGVASSLDFKLDNSSGVLVSRLYISYTGTTTLTSAASTAPFIANIGAIEVARIDGSGRLLVGTSTARAIEPFGIITSGTNGSHVIEGVAGAGVGIACVANSDTTASIGPHILLGRTRGNDSAANIIVQAGDNLGTIGFAGADGTDIRTKAAAIYAEVDGTPGVDDMPGRLVFSTTTDGAASPTERLRITNDGVQAYDQKAPAAVNATATLTVANLKTGIIISTSAAATDMTLPTGTDTEAGFNGVYTNMTFEWSVINTGPSLVRVLAGTAHTIVGSGSVATGTSGRFASRRTTANTFVTYRLS